MAGYSGSSGSSGSSGNAGNQGAGWFIADRVDLPFVDEPGVAGQPLAITTYSQRRWSPAWSASLLLQTFAALQWTQNIICPPPDDPNMLGGEIRDLVRAAEDERADAMGEIIGQSQEFVTEFMAVLGITPNSYPATCRLLYAAEMIGSMVAMHFKETFNRPRPSHLHPALRPPIPVPGHASYPSGHSTQAHLMALFVIDAMPAGLQPRIGEILTALAGRIARNREIAGLHYLSDSVCGKTLAARIQSCFRNAGTISQSAASFTASATSPSTPSVTAVPTRLTRTYQEAIVEARAEWV